MSVDRRIYLAIGSESSLITFSDAVGFKVIDRLPQNFPLCQRPIRLNLAYRVSHLDVLSYFL